MRKSLLMILVLTFGLFSFAQNDESKTKEEGPCKKLMDACKAADFAKGGKSLFKDCMQPILAGKSVEKVSVGADIVAACKAIKDAKRKTKSF